MWWISHSPVVVWGNSVFAYHWSLQTGIERFSGFWSGSPLKVVGGKERLQVSSHPVFKKMGEGFLMVIWLRVKDCPPQKKIRTWFESRLFLRKEFMSLWKMSEVGRETSQGFVPHKFWVDVVILYANKRYEVAYLSVNITKKKRVDAKLKTDDFPVIHIDFFHQLSGKTAKNTTWVMPRKKILQKKPSFASSVKCEGKKKS